MTTDGNLGIDVGVAHASRISLTSNVKHRVRTCQCFTQRFYCLYRSTAAHFLVFALVALYTPPHTSCRCVFAQNRIWNKSTAGHPIEAVGMDGQQDASLFTSPLASAINRRKSFAKTVIAADIRAKLSSGCAAGLKRLGFSVPSQTVAFCCRQTCRERSHLALCCAPEHQLYHLQPRKRENPSHLWRTRTPRLPACMITR